MYEYDSSLAYISLKTAQQFLGMGDAVHGIEINVNDIYQADMYISRKKGKFVQVSGQSGNNYQ